MINNFEPTKFSEYDPWESRRYDLVKEMYFDSRYQFATNRELIKYADSVIAELKKSPEAEDEDEEPKNGL